MEMRRIMAISLLIPALAFAEPVSPNVSIQFPVSGRVTSIDRTSNSLQVQTDAGNMVYIVIDNDIQVLKHGQPVSYQSLNNDDHVVVSNIRPIPR